MYENLLSLPYFQGMSKDDITTMLDKVVFEFIKYNDGETICHRGDDCNEFLILTQGTLQAVSEAPDKSYKITEEGIIKIEVTTCDMAGNETKTTKLIYINKSKPAQPKILSINEVSVEGLTEKEINISTNTVSMELSNVDDGNLVRIKLIDQANGNATEIEKKCENAYVNFTLAKTGKYRVEIVQINMFGTASNTSQGTYYINYDQ